MPVTLDDRERDLAAALPAAAVTRLSVADVLITDAAGGVALAIERKTAADLVASAMDGRLQEQRARLRDAYGERAAYLIEGAVDWADPRVAGLVTGLVLRRRFPVFCAATTGGSAALIAHLDAAAGVGRLDAYGGTGPAVDAPKKKVAGAAAAESMLACVSGVSRAAARAVLDAHGDVRGVIAALDERGPRAVSELTVNGRKLGKVADKLAAALQTRGHKGS